MITKFKLYEKLVKLEDIIDGFINNHINGYYEIKNLYEYDLLFVDKNNLHYNQEPNTDYHDVLDSQEGLIIDNIVIFIFGKKSGYWNSENEYNFQKFLKKNILNVVPDFDEIKNNIEMHVEKEKYNL